MIALAAVLLATAGTFAMRAGSVRAFESRDLPPTATRMLRHAAVAIMASLVITNLPATSAPGGVGAASATGLVAALLVARRTPSPTVVMVVAVAVYALTDALVG